jgi:hypothetical protein
LQGGIPLGAAASGLHFHMTYLPLPDKCIESASIAVAACDGPHTVVVGV